MMIHFRMYLYLWKVIEVLMRYEKSNTMVSIKYVTIWFIENSVFQRNFLDNIWIKKLWNCALSHYYGRILLIPFVQQKNYILRLKEKIFNEPQYIHVRFRTTMWIKCMPCYLLNQHISAGWIISKECSRNIFIYQNIMN